MKNLKDLKDIKGKNFVVRADFNVPLNGNKILDPHRIEAAYKTIDFLTKKGATVILISHLGKGGASLKPISLFLKKRYKITFVEKSILELSKVDFVKGGVFLLENIRNYEQEEKNDPSFAKQLASLGDYFVNDAFSVSHRKHASIVGITKYLPNFLGFQVQEEIKNLQMASVNPKKPFLFILGGAKFETKIPLLKKFIELADNVVIAGALLNNFYKAAGFEIGKSVHEDGYEKQIKGFMKSPKMLIPVDVIVLRGDKKLNVTAEEIEKNDIVVDIGKQSVALIEMKIKKAKTVVWNGPTGWYEKGFTQATKTLAKALEASKAHSVIGGGDTGAVIERVVKDSKKIFISTGGGATLDYLANGSLVGIDAVEKSK